MDHVRRVHGLSQRRACGLIGMDVSSYRYRSRRAADRPLRERLRELAAIRRRFGYRRLAWVLEREGTKVNLKKIYRLYREEGLAVKRRRGRRRAIGTRAPIVVPQEMNQRWSLDFVSDQLGNGRRFRLLNVIDDFNSECLRDVVPFDALLGRPAQHGVAGQLRAVVGDDHRRLAADRDDSLQLADHPQARRWLNPWTRRT